MTGGDALRAMADAFNGRDWDRASELFGDHAEFVDVAMGVTTRGRDDLIAYAQSWATAFPDMTTEVVGATGDERFAAGEFISRGTHQAR
jgi:hypothetical protein